MFNENYIKLKPADLESKYRFANLNRDRSLALFILFMAILVEIALESAEFLTKTTHDNINIIHVMRFIVIPLWFVFAWIIKSQTKPYKFDIIISIWLFLFIIYMLLTDSIRPAYYFTTVLWNIIIILIIYTGLTIPLQLQIISAAILSLGSLVSLQLIRKFSTTAYLDYSTIIAFIVVNIIGYIVAVTTKKSRRHEFALLTEERNIKEQLEKAFAEIKTLQGIIPICSYCKKIRNDKGYWDQLEKYLLEHTNVKISHGLCPECFAKEYPKLYDELKDKGEI